MELTPKKTDPREKNSWFNGKTVSKYFQGYKEALINALDSVDGTQIEHLVDAINKVAGLDAKIWLSGNGGSSAIADHLTCDWGKGTFVDANRRLSPVSMTANTSMLTAIANDFGYEEIFSKQIEMYAQKGDLFIAISSSGNSPNIVNAIKTAKKMGLTTAAFTGFEGGKTRELADIKIHVDFKNYGVVEDCHHIIMQSVAQFYYKSITA